jgi:putative cardiolipin synthase
MATKVSHTRFDLRFVLLAALVALSAGCATLPPGSGYQKTTSTALPDPVATTLGRRFDGLARDHGGTSGYRLLQAGEDGLSARAQIIDAAERTLDLQYYIFRGDKTGLLLCEALLRAADRGVRIRVLIDDGERVAGDEQIDLLDAHPNIKVRIFNPFAYRGSSRRVRALEFLFNAARLDYRMHNKLFVADNAVALMGGRNIGDEYFQIDPESQFGDDDLFVGGPMVRQLSRTFDEYWNSALAIPVASLGSAPTVEEFEGFRKRIVEHRDTLARAGADYLKRIATGEPFQSLAAGKQLVFTNAELVYDSPEKRRVDRGEIAGHLIFPKLIEAAAGARSEFLMVTPFFVPGTEGMALFDELRKRNVRVRVLTNSLESTPELLAHSGYVRYREPLLEQGVELYELRARLGSSRGSGERPWLLTYGTYALHAKMFVIDRKRVLIGSVNFDLRSWHRNTEIGLIIDNDELAQQSATRFDALAEPANSYRVALRRRNTDERAYLLWVTHDAGQIVASTEEPTGGENRREKVEFFRLLPLDPEL